MFFVIIGIVILVVSFVVALLSLIYEQRKVEQKNAEHHPLEEAKIGDSDSDEKEEYHRDLSTGQMVEGAVGQEKQGSAISVPAGDHLNVLSGTESRDKDLGRVDHSQKPILGAEGGEMPEDEDVWWDRLTAGSSGTGNVLTEDSEEQKSIAAIQAEIAKLKGDHAKSVDIEDKNTQAQMEKPNEPAGQRLSGEFSLGDIKKP